MNRAEVIVVMAGIRKAFPNSFKDQAEIDSTINFWTEMLSGDRADLIARATKHFIQNENAGFPPSIGQIRNIAKDIYIAELEREKRERDLLPEPNLKRIPMPDELREKINAMLDRMKV